MTFYYKTYSWNKRDTEISEKTIDLWQKLTEKKNWRIVQLVNGFFQAEYQDLEENWQDVTRRETIEGAEAAIDGSIEHYQKKLEFLKGPTVVKTFE
tara:strand:- start:236 stop:523 length:288 start_codon:yes stop_codon:yes gene_type:complete